MRNAIITSALSVILLMSSRSSLAAPLALEEYTVLAALTLNFARFTQWPEQAFVNSGNNLQVCLVGDNVLMQSFDSISGKAVGNRVIKIINSDKLRNLNQCHILFLSELPNNILSQVFLDTKQYPVLTIGEESDFIGSGGMVAMVNVDGKIQLHINILTVKSSGLSISSNLLRLAKIVGDN
jgi:hypothetical protein